MKKFTCLFFFVLHFALCMKHVKVDYNIITSTVKEEKKLRNVHRNDF